MYEQAPPRPEPKYRKPYVRSDGQRSFLLTVQCANLLKLECGGLLLFSLASPVPLHRAMWSAWQDLGSLSLKE